MSEPRFPEGTPEYEAYRTKLLEELGKFSRGESPYEYTPEKPFTPYGRGCARALDITEEDMAVLLESVRFGSA